MTTSGIMTAADVAESIRTRLVDLGDLDSELIRLARACRDVDHDSRLGVGSAGSWSSLKFFARAKLGPLVEALGMGHLSFESWANILSPGASIGLHDHVFDRRRNAPNKLSAVYFPADHPTPLVFPRAGVSIQPRRGLAVLFPPTAPHLVEEVPPAADERISIAINAY